MKQFQTLCNKKGKEFMHQIAIDDTINGSMMYHPADFRSNTIVDRDIQFILKMSEDSNDWTCIKNPDSAEYRIYMSKNSYSIGELGKQLKLLRVNINLNISAKEAMHAVLDIELDRKRDSHTIDFRQIEYIKEDNAPYSVSLCRRVLKIAKIFAPRTVTLNSTLVFDTERQCYILVGVSTNEIKQDHESHIATEMVLGVTFYHISEKKCRVVYTAYTDVKMLINNAVLTKALLKKKGIQTYEGTMDVIAMKREQDGFARPKNSGGRMETLDDFMAKHLPTSDSKKTWDLM